MVRVVALLEVMWGDLDDKPLRWFRINPYNHSGKRLISLIGHAQFTVTNACPDVVYAANQRGTPCKAWVRRNLKALRPDVLLVCGKVAGSTFEADMCPLATVLTLPHPAARMWSKPLLARTRNRIARAISEAA